MIPKIIHKILIVENGGWPEIPPGMQGAIDSFNKMNPKYHMKLYDCNSCIKYIKKHYDERILNYFLKLKPYASRCDFFRHLLLFREGGWYSDIRQICKTPLEELNKLDKEFYACKDCYINPRYMYPALIGCVPNHPIEKKTYEKIIWNIEHEHYGFDCLCHAGPGAFLEGSIDFIRKYPNKCCIGNHFLDRDQQGFLTFNKKVFIQNKYTNLKGADTSDLKGGNDYGDMWRKWNVY